MIALESVVFRYEEMVMTFDAVFPGNAITAVIGPSGAGKSTLLALIAGFEAPDSGRVLIDGKDMTDAPPGARPVSMIFQDHNSFAHLDVWSNVALGISPSLTLNSEQRTRIDEALSKAGIRHLKSRLPGEVSGGEAQRIAIARALVRDRPVMLLDEPFAALGPALRRDMIELIRQVQEERHLTVVMVTHQPDDARIAAQYTAFVDGGRIRALKPTRELFETRPPAELRAYLGT